MKTRVAVNVSILKFCIIFVRFLFANVFPKIFEIIHIVEDFSFHEIYLILNVRKNSVKRESSMTRVMEIPLSQMFVSICVRL